MRYWLDTEFIEDGETIDLISIAIVAEDGREFYAENQDANLDKAGPWVRDNVLPMLWSREPNKAEVNKWIRDGGYGGLLRHQEIQQEVLRFVIAPQSRPEFWGMYVASDWVVFYQLWGKLVEMPPGLPRYCRELKQECDRLNNPRLPEKPQMRHHALFDARWNKEVWEFLQSIESD